MTSAFLYVLIALFASPPMSNVVSVTSTSAVEIVADDADLNIHEFHLSRTTINYNSAEQSLQLTMNVFLDDLELALQRYGADSLYLCNERERADGEDYIYAYLTDHLTLTVDNKLILPRWVGKEQTEDLAGVWCYLEVPNLPSFRTIDVENTIMIELYDDQKNMTNLQLDKKRVTDVLFTSKKTSETLDMYD